MDVIADLGLVEENNNIQRFKQSVKMEMDMDQEVVVDVGSGLLTQMGVLVLQVS